MQVDNLLMILCSLYRFYWQMNSSFINDIPVRDFLLRTVLSRY